MNIKCAICQLKISSNKDINLVNAGKMIREAAANKADIVILPEIFNIPYDINLFTSVAEEYSGQSTEMLSSLSKELEIYIIGGSICEEDNGTFFNTSYSFNKNGKLIGKHRKLHLFDVDIKNKIRFKESDIISCGSSITILDTEFCKIGILICHDIRFPEIFTKMVLDGAKIIVAPSALSMVTGPYHCEVTARARAVDNQIYFIVASPARDINASFVAYGHSFIVNPWGDKIVEADENECIVYGNIDLDFVEKIREELPLLKQRRPELYK